MVFAQLPDFFTDLMNWIGIACLIAALVFAYLAYHSFRRSSHGEQDLVWHKRYRLLRAIGFSIGAIYFVFFAMALLFTENSGLDIYNRNILFSRIEFINLAFLFFFIIPLNFFIETRKKFRR